jgi:thiamine biosynthesis protein ThiI
MGLILLRYGEIALKGQNRGFFYRKLRRNVRKCLKANGIEGEVWQEGQRIYLRTADTEAAAEAVSRVFGVVSLSPVQEVPADLGAISEEAVKAARAAGLDPSRSFRIRARRADKSFPHISPDIERIVGSAVVEATNARVQLKGQVDLEIGVEVQPRRALVFGQTIPGPGGLPLSSQGRVVALLSSGIDSPVAAWFMMKRGCGIIPVHFTVSQSQTDQVLAIIDALNRHGYGWQLKPTILSHEEVLGPTLARLRELGAERWACLFCKRAMLAKAAEIADELGAAALVTGDSLGQVASQTLSNMEVISYGIEKPILRPLVGLDKTEIMAVARRIGTYDASISVSHACPFLPDRPLTQANVAKLRDLIRLMDGTRMPDPASEGVETRRH